MEPFPAGQLHGKRLNDDDESGFELLDFQNIVKHHSDKVIQTLVYLPLLNSYEKLSSNEIRTFELVAMRWVSSLEESKFSFKVRPDVSLVSYSRYFNFDRKT